MPRPMCLSRVPRPYVFERIPGCHALCHPWVPRPMCLRESRMPRPMCLSRVPRPYVFEGTLVPHSCLKMECHAPVNPRRALPYMCFKGTCVLWGESRDAMPLFLGRSQGATPLREDPTPLCFMGGIPGCHAPVFREIPGCHAPTCVLRGIRDLGEFRDAMPGLKIKWEDILSDQPQKNGGQGVRNTIQTTHVTKC
jgi:hypothetical protein